MNPTEGDHLVQQQHFQKNANAFYNNEEQTPSRGPAPQSFDKAASIFHGVEARVPGQK